MGVGHAYLMGALMRAALSGLWRSLNGATPFVACLPQPTAAATVCYGLSYYIASSIYLQIPGNTMYVPIWLT